MMRSSLVRLMIFLSALVLAANSNAESLDASKSLACDLTKAAQCDGVAQCKTVAPEQIDLPPVVLIDFGENRIASEDGQRTSPISAIETLDDVLVLQGHQNGRGWTMVIDRATGHLSATLAEVAGSFVLAGACTPK